MLHTANHSAPAAHLLGEDSLDDCWVRVRLRVHVADDRDAWCDDGGVVQRLLQLLSCRGHVVSVEGTCHSQAHLQHQCRPGAGDCESHPCSMLLGMPVRCTLLHCCRARSKCQYQCHRCYANCFDVSTTSVFKSPFLVPKQLQ